MGLILYEYRCEKCGKTIESLEPSGTATVPHCKDSIASRIISAVFGRAKLGEITQGKRHTDDRPAWCMNTEGLADGQDPAEWKEQETERLTGRAQAATVAELKERGASYEVGSDIP
jgi:DNA-directed RNA polymerase subunit RPC12/RpoP